MIDCANSVLYNIDSQLNSSGWDSAAAAAAADFVDAHAAESLSDALDKDLDAAAAHAAEDAAKLKVKLNGKHRPNGRGHVVGDKKPARSIAIGGVSARTKKAKVQVVLSSKRYKKLEELDNVLDWMPVSKFSSNLRWQIPTAHYTPPPMMDPKRNGRGRDILF